MTSEGISDGKDDAKNHPEGLQQIHQQMNDAIVLHNLELLNETVKQPTLIEKKQPSSWLEMNALQLEIQHLKSDIDTRNAYIRSLERENAQVASAVVDNQELHKQLDGLIKNLESNNAELHTFRCAVASSAKTAEEAAHMRVQMEVLEDSNNRLIIKNDKPREIIAKHEAQAEDTTCIQASVNDLQVKLTAEENINKQLTTELAEGEEKIKNLTGVAETLKSQNKNIESKSKVLEKQVLDLKNVGNRLCERYTETFQRCNTLQQEIAALKEEKKALTEKLASQLRDLGGFVTDLDLVAEELRIYVCPHNNLRAIHPGTAKETQVKKVWRVASEMWKRWENEAKFLKAYETVRQNILDHTRAHEAAFHLNGDWWVEIKEAFDELDRKRHFCTTYT